MDRVKPWALAAAIALTACAPTKPAPYGPAGLIVPSPVATPPLPEIYDQLHTLARSVRATPMPRPSAWPPPAAPAQPCPTPNYSPAVGTAAQGDYAGLPVPVFSPGAAPLAATQQQVDAEIAVWVENNGQQGWLDCNFPQTMAVWRRHNPARPSPAPAPLDLPPPPPPAGFALGLGVAAQGAYNGVDLPQGWNTQYPTEAAVTAQIGTMLGSEQGLWLTGVVPGAVVVWGRQSGRVPASAAGSCQALNVGLGKAPASAGAYAGQPMPLEWTAYLTSQDRITGTITDYYLGRPAGNFVECNFPELYKTWKRLTGRGA